MLLFLIVAAIVWFGWFAASSSKKQAPDRSQREKFLNAISRSVCRETLWNEHSREIVLLAGAMKLPRLSVGAILAWSAFVKKNELLRWNETKALGLREIAAYEKYGWKIDVEDDCSFQSCANTCYLIHVRNLSVRDAMMKELSCAEAGQQYVATVTDLQTAFNEMQAIIQVWYANLGHRRLRAAMRTLKRAWASSPGSERQRL